MTTTTVSVTTNYSNTVLNNVTLIDFTNVGVGVTATFRFSQFDNVQIMSNVAIDGNVDINNMTIANGSAAATIIDASNWVFTNWDDAADLVTINGSSLADTITGSDRADLFVSSGGIDTLAGGDGDDRFRLVAGSGGTINGGSGTDALESSANLDTTGLGLTSVEKLKFLADQTITLSQAQFGGANLSIFDGPTGLGQLGRLVVNNVSNFDMSALGLTFLNWNVGNSITLNGTAGADVMIAGPKKTIFVGGDGADQLTGGGAIDEFIYFAGDETGGEIINGGGGSDEIRLNDAAGSVYDFSGVSISSVAAVRFTNGATATFLSSQFALGGIAQVFGYAGADAMIFNGSNVDLIWTQFYLNLAPASGGWENGVDTVTINGTGNIDNLSGSMANDVISGGLKDDVLQGNGGADVLNGGDGLDTASYNDPFAHDATVNLFTGATAGLFAAGDTFISIENLQGGLGNDTLTGDAQINQISGGDGNDILDGWTGGDRLIGGNGNDTYYVDSISDTTDETTGSGTGDYVYSTVSFTAAIGIERLYLTGSANVNATGTAGQNDILVGNSGNNVINGLSGNDVMRGGLGNDTYYADSTLDTTDEVTGGGGRGDYVYSTVSFTASQGIERLYLTGTANINATGTAGQNDILVGNSGNNIIDGLSGNDVMRGGLGNDTFYVDSTLDTTDEVTGGGGTGDYVYASVSFTASQGIERLYLTGSAAVNGTGRDGQNDILGGNSGSNVLNGMTGNDVLVGALGNDTLTGGAGLDIFRFDTALNAVANMDTITDFVAVDDLIQLENAVFTALAATGILAAGAFNTGAAATEADDRIIYDTATGALLYDADGLGGVAGVQFALLSTHPAGVSAADFLVY